MKDISILGSNALRSGDGTESKNKVGNKYMTPKHVICKRIRRKQGQTTSGN